MRGSGGDRDKTAYVGCYLGSVIQNDEEDVGRLLFHEDRLCAATCGHGRTLRTPCAGLASISSGD